jgi:soluble lytic murein transglycosylase-like protein
VVRKFGARVAGVAFVALLVSCSSSGVGAAPSAATASPTVRYTPIPTEQPKVTLLPSPTATAAPDYDKPPVAANDPAALAVQLAMVESSLRDPAVTDEKQIAWLGHLQQLAYSRLADFPEWREPVLAALPEKTRAAVTGSLEAGKQLRQLTGPIPKTLPDWKIVAPKPIDQLLGFYKEGEAQFGVPWYYLASVHLVETRMGRIHGLSSAGAQGPMQFMPATWAAYGDGDINDDHDSILGAARYLKANGAPGNMQKALFAYNHSQAYVNALIDYAEVMKADPAAYRGYHGWQVYYPTVDGPVLLSVGWTKE